MKKLTFKQYLDSKQQLIEAIKNTPISIMEYEIRKYCSLTVGESDQSKQLVGLKPHYVLVVEWLYDDVDNPTPKSLRLQSPSGDINETFNTFWTGVKLQKWLSRHAKEGLNNGHKI